MAPIVCPVPQVEESLRPFIRSRQETLLIRQAIGSALQDRVGADTSITQLTLTSIPSQAPKSDASFQSAGLYKQFVEELATQRRAHEKYEAAKSDLQQLRQSTREDQLFQPSPSGSNVRRYVDSIRQKQQQERMEVVRNTLTRLDDIEPHPAKVDVKTAVKELLGPPPDPPSLGFNAEEKTAQIDELSFSMKKALLQAKSDLAVANQAKIQSTDRVRSLGDIPVEVRFLALKRARDELIQWIEVELAKVSDEDDEPDSSDEVEDHVDHEYSAQEVQAQVHDLYERYLSSRQSLLDTVESLKQDIPQDTPLVLSKDRPFTQSPAKAGAQESHLTASRLLTFLPLLIQTTRDEASVLQQTAFLRKQINLSSSETKNTVQRLAGESHLVPADTNDIKRWDTATTESSEKTMRAVQEQIKAGKESIAKTREVLASLQAKRSAIAHLKGTM